LEKMAVAISLDQGKPISQFRLEITRSCELLEWDANALPYGLAA
jgi:hypothetical protein